MLEKELVSIIIPTYNRAHLIGETLASIINQTYANWECIIVDDNSTDNTLSVIENYAKKDNRISFYNRPSSKPKGANSCRNFGFENSNGNYVLWFDSDDIMDSKKLEIQVASLKTSDFECSISACSVFDTETNKIIKYRNSLEINNILYDYIEGKVDILTPSILWKKSFLNRLDSLFNEKLMAAQEWEFFCRVFMKKTNYTVINTVLASIREHSESISYNQSYSKTRHYNYVLARWYVLNNMRKLGLNTETLESYIVNKYKFFLRNSWFNDAFKMLVNFIFKFKSINLISKAKLTLACIIFFLFKKGDFLLKNIK